MPRPDRSFEPTPLRGAARLDRSDRRTRRSSRTLFFVACVLVLSGCARVDSGDLEAPASVVAIACQASVLRFDTGERARSQAAACEIPVPGAAIVLELEDGSIRRFESGDDGRFEFRVSDIEVVTSIGIYGSTGFSALRLARDPRSDDSLLVSGENRWSIGLPAAHCEPPQETEANTPT